MLKLQWNFSKADTIDTEKRVCLGEGVNLVYPNCTHGEIS